VALVGNKEFPLKYLVLTTLLTFSFSTFACEKIKIAHENLLKSNFSVNKNFVFTMDDETKVKLTKVIEYSNGSLSYSKKDVSFIAENFKFKEDDSEPFLRANFTCEDIKVEGEEVIINYVKDDQNYNSHFIYKKEKLLPIKTIVEGEVGALFMSWDIKMIANYSNFKLL
jgi:hypothetical protein